MICVNLHLGRKEENLLIQYYEILELSSFRYKSDILSNIF